MMKEENKELKEEEETKWASLNSTEVCTLLQLNGHCRVIHIILIYIDMYFTLV